MNDKTAPLSREEIAASDSRRAKFFLVDELLHIPEFREAWSKARKPLDVVMLAVKAGLENIGASLSPEARGALLMGEKAYALYEPDVIEEAEAAAGKFQTLVIAANSALAKDGTHPDYKARLKELVEPSGVPGLVDVMIIMDIKRWGIDQSLGGPVSGPMSDLLEATIFRGLTDLSPVEAISETRGSVGRRIARKLGPLKRHTKQYHLQQRIRLWVRNVVLGESINSIASELQRDGGHALCSDPGERVKCQVRDATRILEARRPPGRPRKGGVLRHWKLMTS